MVPREMKGRGEADDGVDGYRSKKREEQVVTAMVASWSRDRGWIKCREREKSGWI